MNGQQMNNRLHNVTNPNQTKVKKVLCLCSAGLLRSPTTANVLHQTYGFNTRAAGVAADYALIPVDDVLLAWADEILCVSKEVRHDLLMYFPELNKDPRVLSMNLPDRYQWNDKELINCIKEQYQELGINLGEAKG